VPEVEMGENGTTKKMIIVENRSFRVERLCSVGR
jgi:hypothetical protein